MKKLNQLRSIFRSGADKLVREARKQPALAELRQNLRDFRDGKSRITSNELSGLLARISKADEIWVDITPSRLSCGGRFGDEDAHIDLAAINARCVMRGAKEVQFELLTPLESRMRGTQLIGSLASAIAYLAWGKMHGLSVDTLSESPLTLDDTRVIADLREVPGFRKIAEHSPLVEGLMIQQVDFEDGELVIHLTTPLSIMKKH